MEKDSVKMLKKLFVGVFFLTFLYSRCNECRISISRYKNWV